jgi:inward rectifier potassium channel
MKKPTFDPGLTQQYTGPLKRAINRDGQFNVKRSGVTWQDSHPYLLLVSVRWPVFLLLVMAVFLGLNSLFAALYVAVGANSLKGAEAPTRWGQYLNAFFFSAHTLTTVGYGNMFPNGVAANIIAMVESLMGLLGFAIATGLVFGRFSRPSARIGFSKTMVVAPYGDGMSLQFRVVNRRSNNIIDLNARLMLMTVEPVEGKLQRRYTRLELEREDVLFFPLTWTIVHPIDETSPFWNKSLEELEHVQAEVLILIKGFDETFGQTVQARYSYRYDELVWGARFKPAFEIDTDGDIRLETNRVSDFELLNAR